MANRQQEKEARRQARLDAERAAAALQARNKRLRLVAGVLLGVLVIAGAVIAITSSGGSGKGPKQSAGKGTAKIPAPKTTNLAEAAKTAGCVEKDYPKSYQDRGHQEGNLKYKTNPPAFGTHNPQPASDGDYVGQGTPPKESLVHSLEHGRVQIQYRPGLPRKQVSQLEALYNEKSDYMQLFQNETKMPYAVAAVAWTHILGCPKFDSGVFDAIRAFRDKWTLKGPELITQAE